MRTILSDEVRKNVMEMCSSSEEYIRIVNNPEYAGKTKGIEKVTLLRNSTSGLQLKLIHKGLMDKFQIFQNILPEQTVIEVEIPNTGEVRSVHVRKDQLAMLKALAYEQCNLCLEYSKTVASLFWDYVRVLVKGKDAKCITYTDAKGSWSSLIKQDMVEYMKLKGV